MNEYCFKIKFHEPFNGGNNQDKIDTFHAHLLTDKNLIELRIYFNPDRFHFDYVFSRWLKKVNWSNIGSYFDVFDIKNLDLTGLDFSQSNIIGTTSSSNQRLNSEQYISIEVDFVKFIFHPNQELKNTAEFYLNDNGFNLVAEYYSVLWQNNNVNFSYARMEGTSSSYKVGEIAFNPEFNFYSQDSRSKEVSTIHKKPKFQLSFTDNTTEDEIMDTFKLISLLASFYYKRTIDFRMAKIHLASRKIVFRKKHFELSDKENKSTIFPIYKVRDIDEIFNKINIIGLENERLKKLELIVKKFNQSDLVDIRSSILLRFAILEICNSGKKESKQVQFHFSENGRKLSKTERTKLLNSARDLILNKIDVSEQEEFKNKWTSSINKIITKPMRSPFIEYLESIGFKPESFDVDFSRIKNIRDSLTHGSTEKYTEIELIECNSILYRINIGLILNQFNIENWIEDLNINLERLSQPCLGN